MLAGLDASERDQLRALLFKALQHLHDRTPAATA
jgi:hypothetical protein